MALLLVTTSAFALGGFLGGHGHGEKSQTYKRGVDAIDVHYKNKGMTNIQTSCPAHSTAVGIECECDSGYEMRDGACVPVTRLSCNTSGLYWCHLLPY